MILISYGREFDILCVAQFQIPVIPCHNHNSGHLTVFFLGILFRHVVFIISINMCVHSSTFLPLNIISQSNSFNICPISDHGTFSLWKLSCQRSSSFMPTLLSSTSMSSLFHSMSVVISMIL